MANDEITTKRKKYEAMIEYVSPQAKIYGKRYASPINNDDITSETELKKWAESQLQDKPKQN